MCFIVFIRFKAAYFLCDFLLLFFYYVMIWRLIFFVSRFMSVSLIRNSWKVSEKWPFTFVLLVCLFFSCLYSAWEYFLYTCMVTSPFLRKGPCARKLQPFSREGLHHATSAVALGRPFNVLRTNIPTRVTSRCIFIVLMLRISVAGLMCLLIFLNYHVLSMWISSFLLWIYGCSVNILF